jgi:hypothetical protein
MSMPASNVLRFSENFDTMTYPECLAFIERSRRQVERMERDIQKHGRGDAVELTAIGKELDDMERRIRTHPDCP